MSTKLIQSTRPHATCHIPARARLRRSTILSALSPDHALTILFLGTHVRTSQWVTHFGIALAPFSLNFRVPTEPEANERLALIPNCQIPTRVPPHPGLDSTVARYCLLWAPTTPSQFCFWELTRELPSGSPIIGLLSRHSRLTSEFLRNPKPVSSQNASC